MCKTKDIREEIKEYIEYRFSQKGMNLKDYQDYSIKVLTMSFLLGEPPAECEGVEPEDIYPDEDMEIYDVAYECMEKIMNEYK